MIKQQFTTDSPYRENIERSLTKIINDWDKRAISLLAGCTRVSLFGYLIQETENLYDRGQHPIYILHLLLKVRAQESNSEIITEIDNFRRVYSNNKHTEKAKLLAFQQIVTSLKMSYENNISWRIGMHDTRKVPYWVEKLEQFIKKDIHVSSSIISQNSPIFTNLTVQSDIVQCDAKQMDDMKEELVEDNNDHISECAIM